MRLSATRSFPPRRLSGWIYLPIVWIAVGSCVTNPATGRKMFSLISESQEIAMGQKYSEQIDATMGLYDDPELQAYVERVGLALAAVAERPQSGVWSTSRAWSSSARLSVAVPMYPFATASSCR